MGTKERRERERDELRTKILDAARELFVKHGYEAVSMRKIAEAIEYSPTVIYQHFADKASLVLALCQVDFDEFGGRFLALAPIKDPVERLREAARVYVRFAVDAPSYYRLMFMSGHISTLDPAVLQRAWESDQGKGDPERDGLAFVVKTLIDGMEQGRFRKDDPLLVAQTVWAAVHGISALHITHSNDPWPQWRPLEKRMEHLIDTLIRGLMVDPDEKGTEARRHEGT